MMRRKRIKAAPNVVCGAKKLNVAKVAPQILKSSTPIKSPKESCTEAPSPNAQDNATEKMPQLPPICEENTPNIEVTSNIEVAKIPKTIVNENKPEKVDKEPKPVKSATKSPKLKRLTEDGSASLNCKSSKYLKFQPKLKASPEENKLRFFERKQKYRKKISDGIIEKDNLTMFDLIFWNPCANPMPGRQSSPRKPSLSQSDIESVSAISDTALEEEKAETEGLEITSECSANSNDDNSADVNAEENILAPQVKIGPNGELVIDEKSLMIRTTEVKNRDKVLSNSRVVEELNDSSHYGKWSKRRKRSAEWTKKETKRFYKALSTVGTDFSLMHTIFAHRSREELKMKFKKEERINRHLIDKALNDCTQFDFSIFDESDYDPEEDRKEAKEAEKEATRKRKEQEKLAKRLEREKQREEKKELKLMNKKRKRILKDTFIPKNRRKTRSANVKQAPSSPQIDIEPQEVICEMVFSDSEEISSQSAIENPEPAKTKAILGLDVIEISGNYSLTLENSLDDQKFEIKSTSNPKNAPCVIPNKEYRGHPERQPHQEDTHPTPSTSPSGNKEAEISNSSGEKSSQGLDPIPVESNSSASEKTPTSCAIENEPIPLLQDEETRNLELTTRFLERSPADADEMKDATCDSIEACDKSKSYSNVTIDYVENRNFSRDHSSKASLDIQKSSDGEVQKGSLSTTLAQSTTPLPSLVSGQTPPSPSKLLRNSDSVSFSDDHTTSSTVAPIKSQPVQTFVPVSEVKHAEDGSLFVDVTTSTGVSRVPVPTLNPDTSGIVVMCSPSESEEGKVFHVYLIAPLQQSGTASMENGADPNTDVGS